MTTSSDPDEIRAEIEQTRAALSDDVNRLTESAKPKNVANRQVEKVREAAGSLKEKVMGTDDTGPGAQDVVADKAYAAKDAVAGAPAAVKQKTQGNPLAAGVIAFGVGLLISGLIPSSQREQEAVGQLQEKLEPLRDQAVDKAKEVADQLKEPAQQAAQSVKATATDAAANVRAEGESAVQDVKDQAADSKETVQHSG